MGMIVFILSVMLVLIVMKVPHFKHVVMGQEKSWGITFWGWLIIVYNSFELSMILMQWEGLKDALVFYPFELQLLACVSLVLIVLGLICGFFILSLKEFGRNFLVILIVLNLIVIFTSTIMYISYQSMSALQWTQVLMNAIISIFIIWYFTRKEIKQQFQK